LAFVSFYFILLALQWRHFEQYPFALKFVGVYIQAMLSFMGAVAVHNCIHCPMFHSALLNKCMQIVLSNVYGHPVSSYVPGHNLSHHKYTQQAKDVMRTTKLRFSWHLLNGLWFFVKIGIDMTYNDSIYFEEQKRLNRPIYRQMIKEKLSFFAVTATLLFLDWRKWIILTFIPNTFAKYCIISLNILQHDGCDMASPYNFARNFTGFFINFFFYNNGYHSIHHLHPGKHWSLLPAAHDKELKPYIHPNLDQLNILTYIWRTFVWPGLRVDFTGKPLILPPDEPDQPWFYAHDETYSTKEQF